MTTTAVIPVTVEGDGGSCVKCGDCCENIALGVTKTWLRRIVRGGDPDVEMQPWLDAGWSEDGIRRSYSNARFILKHWRGARRDYNNGRLWRYSCDMFDPVARTCTAYEDRPPVCSGYPWYGEGPTQERADVLPERCSYRQAPALEKPCV